MISFDEFMAARFGPNWEVHQLVTHMMNVRQDVAVISQRYHDELRAAWAGEAPEPSCRAKRNRGYTGPQKKR